MQKRFLATSKLNVTFEGVPAHAGSNPEAGKSALLAACNAATLISGIPRHSKGLTRVCVGKLIAGESRNVIPAHAAMKIEARGETGGLKTSHEIVV
ncbi:MAG: peptidase dimerization domain-containing protein [Burkholderiales bacterium]|nr:peptidase dimerization domain-containing protein [Burkholderiales bacterium]